MCCQAIIHNAKVLHQIVIGQIQAIPEEHFDQQPRGCNNTIRWNAGHMIYWMDRYSKRSFNVTSAIPTGYETLFNTGTRPSQWTIVPPSKDELLQGLSEQLARLSELTPEMLEARLDSPFKLGPFQFDTAGELFNFALIHEGIHLGIVMSLFKALSSD